jgi:major membrane immunogen (membrane-anchored lipoprotein)
VLGGWCNERELKMKRIAIVLPLAVMLCSCASSEKKHIGTWQATGITESGYAVKFARKGKAEVTTPEGVYPGRYVIDYTKEPVRLDVTWDGKTIKCIMEFLDKKTFKIIGQGDPDKLRPLAFEPAEDVVVFKKVETSKQDK